jgi:ubiquinone/menaquinone biosynthesis C-methylase UbiE
MVTNDRGIESRTPPTRQGHPWFAATYDFLTQFGERRMLGPLRQRLVGAAKGQVLELGAGTGANFRYYPASATIIATEPDPFMLARARKRAAELGRAIALCQCPAEALPFADASFDTVVATLVFCSVQDPIRALTEMRRVLKPTGTFRFIEHVRADGLSGRVQDMLTPIQHRLAAGCHLNRRTASSIEAAGLAIVELEQRRLPLTPLIIGVARARS